jgi:hypothetical protein
MVMVDWTAALVTQLDVVTPVDTLVVHLAEAPGLAAEPV